MSTALPQEMQQHTYAIMNRVEDSHWWFVGRRAILEEFLRQIIRNPESKIQNQLPRSKLRGMVVVASGGLSQQAAG